jgi:hypothetical protein
MTVARNDLEKFLAGKRESAREGTREILMCLTSRSHLGEPGWWARPYEIKENCKIPHYQTLFRLLDELFEEGFIDRQPTPPSDEPGRTGFRYRASIAYPLVWLWTREELEAEYEERTLERDFALNLLIKKGVRSPLSIINIRIRKLYKRMGKKKLEW